MKYLITIICLLMTMLTPANSQTFTELWDQVDQATDDDLPRDAVKILTQISDKAKREGNHGQLLSAEIMTTSILTSISPDSLLPHIKALEAKVIAADEAAKKSPTDDNIALAAVYNAAFAKSIGNHYDLRDKYNQNNYWCKALANPDVLARIKHTNYEPLTKCGSHDAIFNHDLLSLIGHEADVYAFMYNYYASHNNTHAALLMLNEYLIKGSKEAVDTMLTFAHGQNIIELYAEERSQGAKNRIAKKALDMYADYPEASLFALYYYNYVLDNDDDEYSDKTRYEFLTSKINKYKEGYGVNELTRLRNNMHKPRIKITFSQTDKPHISQLAISHTNISDATLTVTRMKVDGDVSLGRKTDKDLLKLRKGEPVWTKALHYTISAPYAEEDDTIHTPNLPYGVYLAELSVKNDTIKDYCVIYVSDLDYINISLIPENAKSRNANSSRIVVVNRITGQPVAGATVRLTKEDYYGNKVTSSLSLTTDSNGEARYTSDKRFERIYISTADDKAFEKRYISTSINYKNYHTTSRLNQAFVYTDRGIYRPGQAVQCAVIVYNSKDVNNIHTVSNKKVTITAKDRNYKEIAKKVVITDSLGAAGCSLDLPADIALGRVTIIATSDSMDNASTSVKVDEYKRPTFEIIIPKLKERYNAGEQVTLPIEAKTYTGLPLAGAKIHYSVVRRQVQWCWWLNRDNHVVSDKEIIEKDTIIPTDGITNIPLTLELPEGDDGYYQFDVNVMVTDLANETHEQSFKLNVSSREITPEPEQPYVEPKDREEYFSMPDISTFPNDGSEVTFKVGSCFNDVYVVYTLFAEGMELESSHFTINHEVKEFKYAYDKKYGEALTVSFAWLRNGKLHTITRTIQSPKPDMSLKYRWHTFRDLTQPGATESWTMQVLPHEGQALPPVASLLATIYDKSLDQFAQHNLSCHIDMPSFSMDGNWHHSNVSDPSLSYTMRIPYAGSFYLNMPYFDNKYFNGYSMKLFDCVVLSESAVASAPRVRGMAKMRAQDDGELQEVVVVGYGTTKKANKTAGVTTEKPEPEVKLRSDFSETAFFTPSIISQQDGMLNITFTLPESMTTWNFRGLLHDKNMRHAYIDRTFIARKDLMVKPNMPRFLYETDKAAIKTVVTNNTDTVQVATAYLEVVNPENDSVLYKTSSALNIDAKQQQPVSFDVPTPSSLSSNLSALIFRIKVITESGASDGEQHLLPILPAKEETITTVPFTQHSAGTFVRDLAALFTPSSTNRTISVEYTNHPEWLIVESLKKMRKPDSDNAIDIATSLYINTLIDDITSRIPEYSTYFTPIDTVNGAIYPTTSEIIKRLKKLQLANGSWTWYPGMDGSLYITTSVAQMLARQVYVGISTSSTRSLLTKAGRYLAKEMSEEADDLREYEAQLRKEGKKRPYGLHPSESATNFLYILSLLQESADGKDIISLTKRQKKDRDYLISLLTDIPHEYTIYGKARAAVIFAINNKKPKALTYLESLKQYSVATEEAGRYYDTRRAYYSWQNYRIPTEVAAIEALRIVSPNDTQTISEMLRWLLHEKRTQKWDTNINTVDAVYAFTLDHPFSVQDASTNTILTIDGKDIKTTTSTMPTGIVKSDDITIDNGAVTTSLTFKAEKSTTDTSWGSVTIRQSSPLTEIADASAGFTITREYTTRDGKVICKLTIVADRDYDFVQVRDNRPACLEPVNQLSGYGRGYYTEIHDSYTTYSFNKMAKGTYTIETPYYQDRQGSYISGTATVQCAYAPEFTARTAPKEMNNK